MAKPTWAEWKSWDQFRRLLNDQRLRGNDQAFKLWHHYHNSKDRNGTIWGFRAEAWYIARKYGWKPATIYAANALLVKCGFLTLASGRGNSNIVEVRQGLGTLPPHGQSELPFIYPSSAPTGISALPSAFASSAPTGISALPEEAQPICDRVISVRDADVIRRKILWQLEAIERAIRHANSAQVVGLVEQRRELLTNLASLTPRKAKPPAKGSTLPPAAPDPPGPMPGTAEFEELKKNLGRAT